MKKLSLLVFLVVLGVLVAGGVALAANIQCKERTDDNTVQRCVGTGGKDTIIGTEGNDEINARANNDVVRGLGGSDVISGGTGTDRMYGDAGGDIFLPFFNFSATEPEYAKWFVENSDDVVYGGSGPDLIWAGFGRGGEDKVIAGTGDDHVFVAQRYYKAKGSPTKITREVIDCGSGDDEVFYDRGIDEIDTKTCEDLYPVTTDGKLPEFPQGS